MFGAVRVVAVAVVLVGVVVVALIVVEAVIVVVRVVEKKIAQQAGTVLVVVEELSRKTEALTECHHILLLLLLGYDQNWFGRHGAVVLIVESLPPVHSKARTAIDLVTLCHCHSCDCCWCCCHCSTDSWLNRSFDSNRHHCRHHHRACPG